MHFYTPTKKKEKEMQRTKRRFLKKTINFPHIAVKQFPKQLVLQRAVQFVLKNFLLVRPAIRVVKQNFPSMM